MAVSEREVDAHPDDAKLAAVYRASASEEPPSRLDAAVLREARRVAAGRSSRTRPAWWMPWRVPLAFAAVAVMSVSIALVVEREGGAPVEFEPSVPRSAAPEGAPEPAPGGVREHAPDAAPPAAHAPVESPRPKRAEPRAAGSHTDNERQSEPLRPETRKEAAAPSAPATKPAADDLRKFRARSSESEAAAELPAPPRSPAAMSAPAPAAAAEQSAERRSTRASPPPARAPETQPYAAAKPLAAERSAKVESESPEIAAMIAILDARPASEWRARIATLRREGRMAEAEALAAEFRRRFPDEPLPPDVQRREP
jgi:hypothetical protein